MKTYRDPLIALCLGLAFGTAEAQNSRGELSGRFYRAIRNNDLASLKTLSKSSDVNVKDDRGATPLMYAAAFGNLEELQLLLDSGAEVKAKSAFDALNTAVQHTAADVLALDRTLSRYGPESTAIREALAHVIAQRLELTWPQHASQAARLDQREVTRGGEGEGLVERIRGLTPQNESQRWLQAHAVALSEALLDARWVVVSSIGTSVPVPFLVVLVFWLTMIFVSFGVFAPRNATVMVALCVCALSVAGAIFLILEMDSPFAGLMTISPEPLRYAYSRINH